MLAKILSSIFIVFSLFFVTPSTSYAQAATTSAQPLPGYIPPTSPVYTELVLHNTFHAISCLAAGSSMLGQPCLTYQVTKNAQGIIQSVPVLSQANLSGGALGTVTSLVDSLYLNPPVRSSEYLASLGRGLGVVKEANAQVIGSGAAVLDPVFRLWQVSRNMAYVIMIVIFMVIGLMIMFRNKVNPQTVITAQASLPGLVIGLILITFSYFFASLLTDLAFIGTNLVGYYFSFAQTPLAPDANLAQDIENRNVLTILSQLTNGISWDGMTNALAIVFGENGLQGDALGIVRAGLFLVAFQTIAPLAGTVTGGITGAVGSLVPGAVLWTPIATALGSAIGGGIAGVATMVAPSIILGFVFYVIALIALIVTMVKLLLKLVNNYLYIIFLTITAPFHFLAASLPGRQGVATSWILNMLCNVLSFPAVAAVLYFATIMLADSFGTSTPPFTVTNAPDIAGPTTLPLFGGLPINFIKFLIGFGAILATPAIPDIVCRAVGRIGQAGQLIGQEFRSGISGGQQYLGRGQSGIGAMSQSGGQLAQLNRPEMEWVKTPRGLQLVNMGTQLQKASGTHTPTPVKGRFVKY